MNNFTQEEIHDLIMFMYDLLYTAKHNFNKQSNAISWYYEHKSDFDNDSQYNEALEIAEKLKDEAFMNIGKLSGFLKKFNDMLGDV